MNNPSQLELVYRSSSAKECRERSLVLSAAGVNHHVYRRGGETALLVSPKDVGQAQAELAAYANENPPTIKHAPQGLRNANGWFGIVGYATVLIVVELLQRSQQYGFNWFESGKTSAGLILDGKWWRTVTALTLHSDLTHLAGNLVIGGLFGLFVGQHLGPGLGWLCILVAGAAGNFLNAAIHPPTHTSVGASTAVFAALGILAGSMWHRRRRSPTRSLARWSPLVGGAVLLSYLGAGGGRTDIGAHLAGFFVGLIVGAVYTRVGQHFAHTARSQLLLAAIAVAILALAWVLALTPT